jgi:hypothetical protein
MIDHINIGQGGKGKSTSAPALPEQCDNCRFFHMYECRRFPPVQLMRTWSNSVGDTITEIYTDKETSYPATEYNAWCGEYERKKD